MPFGKSISFYTYNDPIIQPVLVGVTHIPIDGGSFTSSTITITPPSGLMQGDLLYINLTDRGLTAIGTPSHTMTVDGGQSWSSTSVGGVFNSGMYFSRHTATFNGNWTSDPVLTTTNIENYGKSTVMLVFRPYRYDCEWQFTGGFNVTTSPSSATRQTSVRGTVGTKLRMAFIANLISMNASPSLDFLNGNGNGWTYSTPVGWTYSTPTKYYVNNGGLLPFKTAYWINLLSFNALAAPFSIVFLNEVPRFSTNVYYFTPNVV